MRGNDYMADQVELTGNAVIERLKMDLVPKRVDDEGSVEYYLWAITDQQLHKYLSDAFYGQFVDNTDDLYSVTMPPQRRNHLWIFAPSMELIDWFIDAAGDKNNENADVNGQLKLAYVKMSSVEDRLDEGEYPVVHQITHNDSKKLYAYNIKNLPVINQLMLAQLDEGVSEEELLESMDKRQKTLDDQQEQYKNMKAVRETAPVDLSSDDENTISSDSDDVFDEENIPSAFDDEDDMSDAAFFSEDGDDISSDASFIDEDDNDDIVTGDTELLSDSESDAGHSSEKKPLPKALEFMLAQINAPLLKIPTVHADNGLDDYREKVNNARNELNNQLSNLTENAKQRIISEYYEKLSIAESKVDAKLDPENGDENIIQAYQNVNQLNNQDIQDVDALEKSKRQELLSQMDEFHSQYIKEALAQAEKDWQSVKDTQYVEEPIQSWRKGVTKTIDSQHQERLKRFNDWRDRIKSQYLTQVNTPILEELGSEVKSIVEELKVEQAAARQELIRTEERLFNQNLELQRLQLRQSASVKPVSTDTKPEAASYDEEDGGGLELAPDYDQPEEAFDEQDDVEAINDESLPVVEDNIEPSVEDNDDWLDEENDVQQSTDSDVLASDDLDDDLNLDDLDLEEDDDDLSIDESTEPDYGNDVINDSDLDGLLNDNDEDIKDEPSKSIDQLVNDSDDDVDEKSVIDNTLADLDEEDDDEISSIAPDSKTPSKAKKNKKSLIPKSKKKKSPNKSSDENGKMSKKMMAIIGGAATLVIVAIIVGVMMIAGGNSSGLKVSPSPTNTYVKGNMLSAKQGDKNVALVIKEVKGNKLVVSDVSNNKSYTIDKPSAK